MAGTREDFCTLAELEANCGHIGATTATSGDAQSAITSATDIMWALTGRQYGTYVETLRPDLRGEGTTYFDLGRYPVTHVTSVKVNGETLPTSAYWLQDGRFLVRVDGQQWPSTQKFWLDDSEEETFSVRLVWGTTPPPAVRSATRRLACEIMSLNTGGPTSLSDRVTSVVRQGITREVVSADDFLREGRTGIYEVDLVLTAYNRDGQAALPAVMNPDDLWEGRQRIIGSPSLPVTGTPPFTTVIVSGGGTTVIVSGGPGGAGVAEFDWAMHRQPGSPAIITVDPIGAFSTWEASGGPAFWNFSDGDTIAFRDDINNTQSGLYSYTAGVGLERLDTADTVDGLSGLAIGRLYRDHFSGATTSASGIGLLVAFYPLSNAVMGSVPWYLRWFVDQDTFTNVAVQGLIDHGNAADPHSQYLTASEADLLYDARTAATSAVSAHEQKLNPHPQYALTGHSHALSGAPGSFTAVDIVSSVQNFLAPGTPIDFGTGAAGTMRWTRIGPMVFGKLVILAGADHDTGTIMPIIDLNGLGLPTPRVPELVYPSEFCYAAVPEVTGGDGFLLPLGAIIAAGDGPEGALSFVHGTGALTDGSLGNIWDFGGYGGAYPSVNGRSFYLVGGFNYEVAT